ncbi:DNA recombination/repair protein [Tieghemostelium lacteum]|uniref:DNA repair protein RAD50 n=1 Tax=Tieghemostelium lacteum TaxID=361077 RepID=A0A151ZGI9_TIELA|nr:DNA recombination/repair protein [Tieghemostelium lacteum]|eukprot:KYQ93083.1 DNA recombination/repair protein [Tieghemostelium lacteum]
MTSIEKLLIQGIRSFDPKDGSVIDFYTPLTLLVGSNGAGKTTVIECLKYITTGEMPPNCSNGQAFIHDTKIANETEVKAQIKMRFKNPNGKPIVATRSLSLIQKASKQEYRQIDSSLQSYNTEGQKVSKSFRCSDLDKEIPELMGVAKPILKHVIFCHQEESNWPLSESSKLKVKFDEIFAAVRYTKALKAIKDKRKELMTQIKEYKLKLEVVSNNKDHAHKLQSDLKKCEEKLKKDNLDLERIKGDMVESKKEIDRVNSIQDKINSMTTEISVLEARKKEMERIKQQYMASLTEVLEETDEELIAMSDSFNDELGTMKQAEAELAENLARLTREKQELQKKQQDNQADLVRIQVQQEQYQQMTQERDKEILEFIGRYKMKGYENLGSPLAKEHVEKFLKEISDKLKLLTAALTESSSKNPVQKLQQDISDSKMEVQKIQERITNQQQLQKQNVQKIQNLDKEISGYLNSSQKSQELENEIQRLEKEIQDLELVISQANLQQKISDLQASKKANQDLSSQRELLKEISQYQTRINMKTKDLESRSSSIDQKLSPLLPNLNQIFLGGQWQLETLDKQLSEFTLQNNQKFNVLVQNNQTEQKGPITKLSNEISFIQKELDKKIQDSLKFKSVMELDIDKVSQEIKNQQEKLSLLERSSTILESEEIVYKEYIEKANLNRECSLCKTEMKNEKDLEVFVNHLSTHTLNIPEKLQQQREEIKNLKQSLVKLNSQHADLLLYNELKSAITNLNTQITQLTIQLRIKQDLDQTESAEIQVLRNQTQLCDQVSVQSKIISQLLAERDQLKLDISNEQQQISRLMGSSLMTLEEFEKSIETKQKQWNADSELLDQLQLQSKEQNDALFTLKNKRMASQNLLTMHSNSSGIIERLKGSKSELALENENIDKQCLEHQQQVQDIQVKISQQTTEYESEKEKFETKMSTLQKEKNLFQTRIESIRSYHGRIVQFKMSEDSMARIQKQNVDLQEMIKVLDADYAVGDQSITEIRNNLSQVDVTKRTIADNIAYRQQISNLNQLAQQIVRKREIVKTVVEQESANLPDLQRNMEILKSKYDQITGQTTILQHQLESCNSELKKPIYKGVDETYKDLFLKLQATEFVSTDLDKYFKALDKSLMKYHTLKMDEINKSIREIWQTTYKGNDIDTIEIRSEETKTANKTVNYRVVMIKGEVELDMRGRCSAGQKVLACLVIRMALAENFCANCGILSLDEPTSHLDRSNIESFANSLLNIIETRKNQKGFQLIIITHDEEFVQYLSRGNFCDYYWRVTKNSSQHSTLERKAISTINS